MVQTITAWANGSVNVNTGTNAIEGDGVHISNDLQTKFDAVVAALMALGGSEIHVEKDTFRQFEHVVIAGEVFDNPFGATVSSADFDWIMNHIDTVLAEQEAAQLAAIQAAEAADSEPT
jgi:hypothetical protein